MFQAEYQFGCFSHQKKKRLEEERLLNCLEMPLFCFFSVSSFPVAINECLPIFLQLLTRDSGYESHVDRKWCDWYTDYTCPYRYIYIFTHVHTCVRIYVYIYVYLYLHFQVARFISPQFSMLFLILPKSVFTYSWKNDWTEYFWDRPWCKQQSPRFGFTSFWLSPGSKLQW